MLSGMFRIRTRLSLSVFAAFMLCATGCPGFIDDDAGLDDAGLDDAGLDDAGLDDAGLDDAGAPDAGPLVDGGTPVDAGVLDAGSSDAGTAADAGTHADAGVVDAGASDAGAEADGGVHADAGAPVDAGIADAGAVVDGGEGDGGTATDPYWDGVDTGENGQAFLLAIHARLASSHIVIAYDALPDAYLVTDRGRGCGELIFDVYSSFCWDPDDRCGNYNGEGQCYNREHSWPKSWWGGSESIAPFSDLFHVIPADGYVNNRRGNLPFGHVTSAIYTSTNGSRVGACAELDALGDCFEPKASLKGDFARIYFYMAARYEAQLACCARPAVNGADLNPWEEALLREWHIADPVDDDERARNDAVFSLQGNRNPFVDHPEWVLRISDF
jgi:endonuclease I